MENEVKEVVTEVVESGTKKVVDITKPIIFACGVITGACARIVKDKIVNKFKRKKDEPVDNEEAEVEEEN